jgi:HEAT repeat protein
LRDTVEYLLDHHEPDVLPLLLNVFGDGDAGGIYLDIGSLLEGYPREEVVTQLAKQLTTDRRPLRYWAAQFAANFPDERLVIPLGKVLREDDDDMRSAAIIALEQIGSTEARNLLQRALARETNPELRRFIREALDASA